MNAQQTTLWAMEYLENKRAKAVGSYGESIAKALLEDAGYLVSYAHEGEKRGDLCVIDQETGEIIRVEVKTARRGADGRFTFSLERRNTARVMTSAYHSDFVILLAVTKQGTPYPFVIPVSALGYITKIVISSGNPVSYSGKWSKFRRKPHEAIRLPESAPCLS